MSTTLDPIIHEFPAHQTRTALGATLAMTTMAAVAAAGVSATAGPLVALVATAPLPMVSRLLLGTRAAVSVATGAALASLPYLG